MLFPLPNPTLVWSRIVGGRLLLLFFFFSPISFFSLAHEQPRERLWIILHRCLDCLSNLTTLPSLPRLKSVVSGPFAQILGRLHRSAFLVCGEIANEVDAHNRPALLAYY
ncbi:hypothetical protein F4781DRAFT_221882 [Annulohypoxylon bovei var. microspora]|nr:hypothetical protein F4781DRAFT_221882 [Annulohypoxylon bovei var. microspora]